MGPDTRDAIARELAAGLRPSDVARAHGIDPSYLSALLRDDGDEELKMAVASHRELIALGAQQLIAKTWLAANDAIDSIISIARDRTDKKHYDANVYLIEKVWPTRQVQEQTVTHHLSADVAVQITEGLQALRTIRTTTYDPTTDINLKNGKDVTYGVDPQELQPPGASVEGVGEGNG